MRRLGWAATIAAGYLGACVSGGAAQTPGSVDDVVLSMGADARPEIRVHVQGGASLRHFELSGPDRIVLDLSATALFASAPEVPTALRDRIADVRVARFQTDIVRVVIDTRSPEAYSVERRGDWWIVTFDRPTRTSPQVTGPIRIEADTAALAPASPAPPTALPEGTLEVQVTRVSGSTLYIDAGSQQGLIKGQTVQAERAVGRGRGSLNVLSTTTRGAVLGFAGRPFPITRGDGLRLRLPQTRGPESAVAEASSQTPEATVPEAGERAESLDPMWALPPNVSGRISMELDGRASRTDWDAFSLNGTRTFLIPLARVQFTARELAGGVTVRGRVRAAYRYGSDGAIDPTASVRVYEFDAEKRFEGAPVRVQIGRFFSPYEAFSGYWDGVLMRVGGDAVGIGGVVGLEPHRWNQGFSTTRPKVSGFVDFRSSGRNGGIEGDFAVTHVRPSDGRPNQLYFGSSGRTWVGRLGVSHTIQVDQRPDTREWVISDLLVQSTIPVSRNLELRGRWSRREPNYFWLENPFSYRRDDAGGGTTVRWRGGALLTDVTLHRVDGDSTWTRSASAALRLNSVSRARLGMRAAVNLWDAPFGRVTTASVALDRILSQTWFSAAYRIYRSQGGWQDLLTHQVDAMLSWSLPDGVRVTGLASSTVGSGLLQQRVSVSVSRSF